MKLSGGILVLVSMILLGTGISSRLKKRCDFLGEILVFLSSVSVEIEYVSLPVYDILKKICMLESCKSLDFVSLCLDKMKKGGDFSASWSQALDCSLLPLKKDEKEKLKGLGSLIGTSDISGQRAILALYADYFSAFYKRAQAEYEKYGKTSVTVSTVVGLGALILLM